jgi:hypothetical protein
MDKNTAVRSADAFTRINMEPDSRSEPDSGTSGAAQFRTRLNDHDRADQRRERLRDTRGTMRERGSESLPARALKSEVEQTIERIVSDVRIGRSSWDKIDHENRHDIDRLKALKATLPYQGRESAEVARLEQQVRIRTAALEQVILHKPPTQATEVREVGWRPAARASSAATRRRQAEGRRASRISVGRRQPLFGRGKMR